MVMILQRFGELLQQCSKTKSTKYGIMLHGVIIKMGTEFDLYLSNHLINMYAKCNDFEASHKIFDWMPNKNLVSWSVMISGYDQAGIPSKALSLFAKMKLQPNEYIYGSVFSACATLSALLQGEQVHAQSIRMGYDAISFVSNSLITMYMKCGRSDEAFNIFRSISEPNSISYNAMITGYADNLRIEKSLKMFKLMNKKSLVPDRFSYVAILGSCMSIEHLDTGLGLHCQTIKLGLDSTCFVGNVILTMYSKFNLIKEFEYTFWSITEKDVITWNTFIASYSQCGEHKKALMMFKEMLKLRNNFGVRPDDFTLASAFTACAELASVHYGVQLHAHLIKSMLKLDTGVYNAMINMYAKCGCIQYSLNIFYCIENKNLVSWNTMIVGLGNHGHGKASLRTFEQMKEAGQIPDSVTFVGLLTACNHAGLVDEGLVYFKSMRDAYGISPGIEHLSCLVDMLGRAGRLVEAEDYVKMFNFQKDPVIWGNLLSSCRLHKDVVVGERVANRLLELQPNTSSPYVLLSNLYASDGKWDGVAEARKLLKGSGVKKEPGYSLIEVKGITEKFTVGGSLHERNEIIDILATLNWEIKRFYSLA